MSAARTPCSSGGDGAVLCAASPARWPRATARRLSCAAMPRNCPSPSSRHRERGSHARRPIPSTTTWNEPTGAIVLEAMAHEVSVIGSRTGVLPELIGTAGLVTPPGDAEELSGAIGQLFDPDVRLPLARAARARAIDLYSDDAVA